MHSIKLIKSRLNKYRFNVSLRSIIALFLVLLAFPSYAAVIELDLDEPERAHASSWFTTRFDRVIERMRGEMAHGRNRRFVLQAVSPLPAGIPAGGAPITRAITIPITAPADEIAGDRLFVVRVWHRDPAPNAPRFGADLFFARTNGYLVAWRNLTQNVQDIRPLTINTTLQTEVGGNFVLRDFTNAYYIAGGTPPPGLRLFATGLGADYPALATAGNFGQRAVLDGLGLQINLPTMREAVRELAEPNVNQPNHALNLFRGADTENGVNRGFTGQARALVVFAVALAEAARFGNIQTGVTAPNGFSLNVDIKKELYSWSDMSNDLAALQGPGDLHRTTFEGITARIKTKYLPRVPTNKKQGLNATTLASSAWSRRPGTTVLDHNNTHDNQARENWGQAIGQLLKMARLTESTKPFISGRTELKLK